MLPDDLRIVHGRTVQCVSELWSDTGFRYANLHGLPRDTDNSALLIEAVWSFKKCSIVGRSIHFVSV
jgi:hypothetical protein